jgi:hypothetical protein
LQSFDDALQEDEGWGWMSVDLALLLHQASTKLQHWNSSVLELAVEFGSSTTQGGKALEEDAAMEKLLATLERENPYLSGAMASYLDEIVCTLEGIKLLFQGKGIVTTE